MKQSTNDIKNDLIRKHNNIRRNPRSIIPILQQRESYYNERLYFLKDHPGKAIRTNEGYKAVMDLIEQLKRAEPFEDLIYSQELEKAAQDHADFLEDHQQASAELNLQQRVQRYIDWEGHLFQNVEYGFMQPQQLLYNLLIDDGLKMRPNRLNILNHETRYMGVGVAHHAQYNIVAVFVYATKLRPKVNKMTTSFTGSMLEGKNTNQHKYSQHRNTYKRRSPEIIKEKEMVSTNTVCSDKCLLF